MCCRQAESTFELVYVVVIKRKSWHMLLWEGNVAVVNGNEDGNDDKGRNWMETRVKVARCIINEHLPLHPLLLVESSTLSAFIEWALLIWTTNSGYSTYLFPRPTLSSSTWRWLYTDGILKLIIWLVNNYRLFEILGLSGLFSSARIFLLFLAAVVCYAASRYTLTNKLSWLFQIVALAMSLWFNLSIQSWFHRQ